MSDMTDEVTDKVTVGELFRALGKVEKSVDDGFTKVNERIDGLRSEFVSKELYESERDALRDQIAESGRTRRSLVTTALALLAVVVDAFYFLTHIRN